MKYALVNRFALVSAITFGVVSAASAQPVFKVEITNLTKAQILSPAVVATHSRECPPMFEVGQPASDEIAMLAEDAMADALIEKLNGYSCVNDVQTLMGAGGPIMPGETASVEIEFDFSQRWVSLVSMLVTTNDAFIGLVGARGPQLGTRTELVPAYDAGSEANTEDCTHIPGPPCGNGGVRVVDGAEGYIYVHNGIHGIASLSSDAYDWRNPTARIRITRDRGDQPGGGAFPF